MYHPNQQLPGQAGLNPAFSPMWSSQPTGAYPAGALPTPPSSPYVSSSVQRGGVRLNTIPLPAEEPPIRINPVLTGAHAYRLTLDLAIQAPGYALPPLAPDAANVLSQPATNPAITELRIVHDAMPGALFIVADPSVGYVRVMDVLSAVYRGMSSSLGSLAGTKFVGLAHNVARSNRILGTQDKYQDRTWILMTHNAFVPVQ